MPTSPSVPSSSPSTARPAANSAIAAPSRPGGIGDYRSNIDRQAREQKSIGGILNIIVYSLIGLFVIGAALAGYGAHVLSMQIHQQSVTMSDLDSRYAAQNEALTAELKTTQQALIQVQAQAGRQQEVALRQQELINKLLAATTDDANGVRQAKTALAEESDQRAAEIASLRTRVRELESKSEALYRP
jgi:hypothetical protein